MASAIVLRVTPGLARIMNGIDSCFSMSKGVAPDDLAPTHHKELDAVIEIL
jgi:hypothetical protein